MHPKVARSRSAVAVAVRRGDALAAVEARRDLAAAKLEDYITRTVDAAPPLDDATRDRLALLLRGTAAPPGVVTAHPAPSGGTTGAGTESHLRAAS